MNNKKKTSNQGTLVYMKNQ